MIIGLIIGLVLVAAMTIYSLVQQRKMAKKNTGVSASQFDATVAQEGATMCDIAGTPPMYGAIVDVWDKSSTAITKKSGK